MSVEEAMEQAALLLACAKAVALGFLVAAPVGPVGALCISRTLGNGAVVGLATGLGAATVHGLWTSIIVFGLASSVAPIGSGVFAPWASSAGAVLLAFIGVRACVRRSALLPAVVPVPTAIVCASAYFSGIALASANPTTPLLFLSTMPDLFPRHAQGSLDWVLLAFGTFMGSCFWWIILSSATASLRRHVTVSVLSNINRVTGAILIGLAGLLLSRALQQ
jgi:threonine/homoserine/homoserine lactone efflux protein